MTSINSAVGHYETLKPFGGNVNLLFPIFLHKKQKGPSGTQVFVFLMAFYKLGLERVDI